MFAGSHAVGRSTAIGIVAIAAVSFAPSARAEVGMWPISGDAVEKQWISGLSDVVVQGWDSHTPDPRNVSIEASLDGRIFDSNSMSGPGSVSMAVYGPVPTIWVEDGIHTITGRITGYAGETAETSARVRIDNTAPTSPVNAVVEGGAGWHSSPAVRVTWTNPPQEFAPLAGVRYRVCPAQSQGHASCMYREISGSNVTRLPDDVVLPAAGLWTARVWLVDAAGNASEESAYTFDVGYDPTPPHVAGFVPQDPNDPARVTVAASDDGAPITGGSIEVQRRGQKTWRPLKTGVTAGGLTALMPDDKLRRGRYRLRATVTNAAGLQQGTDRSAGGSLKALELPIRIGSRLQGGRRVGKVCRRVGKKRRCRFKLSRRVPVEFGRPITLRARLRSANRPVANQPLEVWERISISGAKWKHIATKQSDRRGRLRYKAPPGLARKLRFRYPGTPHVRGDSATIALNVQAKSSIHVSRRNVINGEYVTFNGRLRSRPIPPGGVLVELQVRSRGKWRTFAQPRANAKGGWRYQYRFETVRGGARYRFRARVRRQAGYPYATGSSRQIGVRVHGL